MSVALNRITGLRSGEKIQVEEQDKTGYKAEVKPTAGHTFPVAEQVKTGYEVDVRYPTGLTGVQYDAVTLADDYCAVRDLGLYCYGIILYAIDSIDWFRLSPDNITWGPGLYVPAYHMLGFDVQVRYWKVKRHVAGVGTLALVYGQAKL